MMATTKAKKAEMKKMENEWQAESDLGILIEAEKIKRDPKRKGAAMEIRKAMIANLQKLEGKSA